MSTTAAPVSERSLDFLTASAGTEDEIEDGSDSDSQRPSLRGVKSSLAVDPHPSLWRSTSTSSDMSIVIASDSDRRTSTSSTAVSNSEFHLRLSTVHDAPEPPGSQPPLHLPPSSRGTSSDSLPGAPGRAQLHPAVLEAFLRTLPYLIFDQGGGFGEYETLIKKEQFLRHAERLGLTRRQAEQVLLIVDTNGDGDVDLAEVEALAESAQGHLELDIRSHYLHGATPHREKDAADDEATTLSHAAPTPACDDLSASDSSPPTSAPTPKAIPARATAPVPPPAPAPPREPPAPAPSAPASSEAASLPRAPSSVPRAPSTIPREPSSVPREPPEPAPSTADDDACEEEAPGALPVMAPARAPARNMDAAPKVRPLRQLRQSQNEGSRTGGLLLRNGLLHGSVSRHMTDALAGGPSAARQPTGNGRIFSRRHKLPDPIVRALIDNLPLVLDCSNVLDMFELLDRDSSGTLDRDEFVSAVVPLLNIDEYQAEQMFEALDVSGDGVIGLSEFSRINSPRYHVGLGGKAPERDRFGRSTPAKQPEVPQWRKWLQAFSPAMPTHPSLSAAVVGLLLAVFWRTSPDLIARRRGPDAGANGRSGKGGGKGRATRRLSALPQLQRAVTGRRKSDDEAFNGLASIGVDDFCDQAEEELVARAAEVATEVRLLQNELRQVRLKTRQLRIMQPKACKARKDRMCKHETLTDTLWNSLDSAKHGLDPFIRAHDIAMEKRSLEERFRQRRSSVPEHEALPNASPAPSFGRGPNALSSRRLLMHIRRSSMQRSERRSDPLSAAPPAPTPPAAADHISESSFGRPPPSLSQMGSNESADELQRLGLVPGPWTQFVPTAGAHKRVAHATYAAVALLAWLALFLGIERGHVWFWVDTDDELRLPLSLRLCRLVEYHSSVIGWTMFGLFVLIYPVSVLLILRAFRANVNWGAIVFLGFAYNVWMILLQTAIRTGLIISSYSRNAEHDELDGLMNATCGFNATSIEYFSSFSVGPCLAVTILHALTHMALLVAYMLTDLLKAKGPFLRLWLGFLLMLELWHEISARSGVELFPQEQTDPTGTLLDWVLAGATTQRFILNLDRSVWALMVGGFVSTILRPESCAFILLPCRDSSALFFYRQDRRTRRLLGTRRYERLSLWLQYWRNRIRKNFMRHCCGVERNSFNQRRTDRTTGRFTGATTVSSCAQSSCAASASCADVSVEVSEPSISAAAATS